MLRFFAWLSDRGAPILAASFGIYGLVFATFFTVSMPPFMNADELMHILRASQISRGQLAGMRFGNRQSGGKVDQALVTSSQAFVPIVFHESAKVTRAMYADAEHGWSGREVWTPFPNTSVYPPTFYLPAAAGLGIGRHLHMSVLHSIYLARFGNAVVSIAFGSLAIAVSGLAAPYLFMILSLPMSLALMANVSQDGVMLGCTAAALGLAASILQGKRHNPTFVLVVVSVALALLCMARPPYLPVMVVPLLLPGVSRARRLAGAAVVLFACLIWSAFVAGHVMGVLRADDTAINAGAQLGWIAHHPLGAVSAILRSVHLQASTLTEQFVGNLGWLDTRLPGSYVTLACFLLPLSILLAVGPPAGTPQNATIRLRARLALAVIAAILASTTLIYLIQYLTWNEVGSSLIEGVQGRYFLPLAVIAAIVLPGLPAAPVWWRPARGVALSGLMLFPILTIGVVIHAIVVRYYLT